MPWRFERNDGGTSGGGIAIQTHNLDGSGLAITAFSTYMSGGYQMFHLVVEGTPIKTGIFYILVRCAMRSSWMGYHWQILAE